MRIPKYQYYEIQANKVVGYIVLWQKRIVAIFRTLRAAERYIRVALKMLRALRNAKEIFADEMGASWTDFLIAAGTPFNGFVPLFPVAAHAP